MDKDDEIDLTPKNHPASGLCLKTPSVHSIKHVSRQLKGPFIIQWKEGGSAVQPVGDMQPSRH